MMGVMMTDKALITQATMDYIKEYFPDYVALCKVIELNDIFDFSLKPEPVINGAPRQPLKHQRPFKKGKQR